jgi:hypothetical protein
VVAWSPSSDSARPSRWLFAAEVEETPEAVRELRTLLSRGRQALGYPRASTYKSRFGEFATNEYALPAFDIPGGTDRVAYDISRSDDIPFGFASVHVLIRDRNDRSLTGGRILADLDLAGLPDATGRWEMDSEERLAARLESLPPRRIAGPPFEIDPDADLTAPERAKWLYDRFREFLTEPETQSPCRFAGVESCRQVGREKEQIVRPTGDYGYNALATRNPML